MDTRLSDIECHTRSPAHIKWSVLMQTVGGALSFSLIGSSKKYNWSSTEKLDRFMDYSADGALGYLMFGSEKNQFGISEIRPTVAYEHHQVRAKLILYLLSPFPHHNCLIPYGRPPE